MQPQSFDIIVIGAGVIGASVAFHLAELGAKSVLVLDRDQVGSGTGAQSSGILRTHYSVPENVRLAHQSWAAFAAYADYVDDPEAGSGLVQCGYMIAARGDQRVNALKSSIAAQRLMGVAVEEVDGASAHDRLPIAEFHEHELIGYEPQAGYADAYLVNTGFARAARRRGVKIFEGVGATGLISNGSRVTGVKTAQGNFNADLVISTQNMWALELAQWLPCQVPLVPERHLVIALQAEAAYTSQMPVFKDLASDGMLYYRSYGGEQMLVSEGLAGEALMTPDNNQGDVSMDKVVEIGAQVAQRFRLMQRHSWHLLGPVSMMLPQTGILFWVHFRVLTACWWLSGFLGTGLSCHRQLGRSWRRPPWVCPQRFASIPTALSAFRRANCWWGSMAPVQCLSRASACVFVGHYFS